MSNNSTECKHVLKLPNPAGGAWYCADCKAYPLLGPYWKDLNAEIIRLREQLAKAQSVLNGF
jgi:hypothetical protein